MENSCNYVDPVKIKQGKQYYSDLFSHITYDNSLCIQSDDDKTRINKIELKQSDSLPIYCIIAHGEINTNIDVSLDNDFKYHVTTPASTFFRLKNQQYAYDISPIGGLMSCNNNLKQYIEYISENHIEYKKVLFGPNYKQFSTPLISVDEEDFDLDSALFSPPLYSTINKSLTFISAHEWSSIRFGIIQLNKPTDEEVKGIINSIGQISRAKTIEEQTNRIMNMNISSFGKLTNNADAEEQFVNHLKMNNYKCSLEKLTDIFGKGIYIMATCSPLVLNINIQGKETVKYNSEMAITSKVKKTANLDVVDRALYAFNTDLQNMVNQLNYRWMEMVQHNPDVKLKTPMLGPNVTPSKKHYAIADIREIDSGEETATDEETEGGGKKKRKQKTKKRKQKTKKRRFNHRRRYRTRRS
jgi:hypothetical protein